MDLFALPEGGETVLNIQQRLCICRACRMQVNSALKTEADWLQHLQTVQHQNAHKSLNLPRYLWDTDRTILIHDIIGIHQNDILGYLSRCKYNIIDFCYSTSKPGGVNNCHALLASM